MHSSRFDETLIFERRKNGILTRGREKDKIIKRGGCRLMLLCRKSWRRTLLYGRVVQENETDMNVLEMHCIEWENAVLVNPPAFR